MKAKKKKLCGSGKNVGRIKNSMGGGDNCCEGKLDDTKTRTHRTTSTSWLLDI